VRRPQKKPNARTLRRLVSESLAAADTAAQLEDQQAVGAVILTEKEWQAANPKAIKRRGRPKHSVTFTEPLRYFVHAYTPWAKYALRCRSALREVRGHDPSANLWCLFALTYFNGDECQWLLQPEPALPKVDGLPYEYCARAALPHPPRPAPPSTARLSKRRREAVTALLHRAQPSDNDTIAKARQLCAEMRRVKLPSRPTRSFALKDGNPSSPVWFLGVLTKVEPKLSAQGHLTPGEITRRIGEKLLSPLIAGRKRKLPRPTQPA
jgi:hypothetical protein